MANCRFTQLSGCFEPTPFFMPKQENRSEEFISIRQIADEIRARVRKKSPSLDDPAPLVREPPGPQWRAFSAQRQSIAGGMVTRALEQMYRDTSERLVGRLPSSPPTLRGRIGRFLVLCVQRALFWYTPQIQEFQRSTAAGARETADALRELSRHLQQLEASVNGVGNSVAALTAGWEGRIAGFGQEVSDLRSRTGAIETTLLNFADSPSFAALRADMERLAAQMAAEAAARQRLALQTDALSTGLNQVRKHTDERLTRVEETIAALRSEQERAVSSLEERFAASGLAAREAVEQTTARLAARIDAEIAAREELTFRVDALDADLARAASNLAAREAVEQTTARLAARIDAEIAAREELTFRADALAADLARAASNLPAREAVEQTTARLAARIDAEIAAREELTFRVDALAADLARAREGANEALRLKTNLLIQSNRLDLLFSEVRHARPKSGTEPTGRQQSLPAALYVQLEDVFRGTREDIKQRLGIYLPRLRERSIGTAAAPILDLGCGRGEWLEVAAENGMTAVGVDSNGSMVEECRKRGFSAEESGAIEFLRTLPADSQGAVTSFHMIEHIPMDSLMELLDETVRVLKPGGLAIFETPNPENVFVGSYTFYFDPTHRHPIPAPLLSFLAEARGLCSPEILFLHPYQEWQRMAFDDRQNGIAEFLNRYFYGPQDYAVLATKV
jgi:2-polyprenyl-3-methyl-5-hydroxy-6-metoxy-1,4-benzoquinol methylase